MRAVVLYEHGGPEQLVYEEHFPDPHAGPGEVVLRVQATSLNYHDVFTRRGMPGITIPLPMIPGLDLAGDIVEVGPGVADWAIGERVLVDPVNRVEGGLMGETVHGGLAEFGERECGPPEPVSLQSRGQHSRFHRPGRPTDDDHGRWNRSPRGLPDQRVWR